MCHKTAGLVANILEAHDFSTVVIGTMPRLLEAAPRSLVTPHGDAPIGEPGDGERHREIVARAIDLLRTAERRTPPVHMAAPTHRENLSTPSSAPRA